VVFTSDETLATGSFDGDVILWDTATGNTRKKLTEIEFQHDK